VIAMTFPHPMDDTTGFDATDEEMGLGQSRSYSYRDTVNADLSFNYDAIAFKIRQRTQQYPYVEALKYVFEIATRLRDAELASRAQAAKPVLLQCVESLEFELYKAKHGLAQPLDLDLINADLVHARQALAADAMETA